jgi:hypothetical protein
MFNILVLKGNKKLGLVRLAEIHVNLFCLSRFNSLSTCQSSKLKFEFTGPNQILDFIFVIPPTAIYTHGPGLSLVDVMHVHVKFLHLKFGRRDTCTCILYQIYY